MSDKKEKLLREIFFDIFPNINKEGFNLDKDRSEFEGWDSLAHMQLVAEIESRFGVTFNIDDLMNINKPTDFLNFIEKRAND